MFYVAGPLLVQQNKQSKPVIHMDENTKYMICAYISILCFQLNSNLHIFLLGFFEIFDRISNLTGNPVKFRLGLPEFYWLKSTQLYCGHLCSLIFLSFCVFGVWK